MMFDICCKDSSYRMNQGQRHTGGFDFDLDLISLSFFQNLLIDDVWCYI